MTRTFKTLSKDNFHFVSVFAVCECWNMLLHPVVWPKDWWPDEKVLCLSKRWARFNAFAERPLVFLLQPSASAPSLCERSGRSHWNNLRACVRRCTILDLKHPKKPQNTEVKNLLNHCWKWGEVGAEKRFTDEQSVLTEKLIRIVESTSSSKQPI